MKRALVIVLLVLAAMPLLAAVAGMPRFGSAEQPAYTHVARRYLERGAEEAGAENIVTGVILNYRGFDTNGEVTVIFTACAAVLAVLASSSTEPRPARAPSGQVPESVVVRYVVRLLAPFVALFALYVVLFGEVSPGGGFQGGTVFGALVIVMSVSVGRDEAERLVPARVRTWLQAAGPVSFLAVGAAGAILTGWYLGFPVEAQAATKLMLMVLEFGIGIGGATVLASIFWRLGDER